MFRPDAGNFNRFLTSLGLLLLAAALAVPYLYFKNLATLEITRGELAGMTRVGRQAIVARQQAVVNLEPWVIGLAAFSAGGGLVLVVIGGHRLKRAQESEDEEGRLRRDRTRLEMKKMSPSERAEALSEKEMAEKERLRLVTASPYKEQVKSPSDKGSVVVPVPTRQESIARALNRLGEVFSDDEPFSHRLKLQVSLRSVTDSIRVDALFEAVVDQLPDVLLDLQVSNPRFIEKSVRNRADDLIAKLSRYKNMSRRETQGWLVVVIPEELEGEGSPDSLEQAERRLRGAVGDFGSATIVNERSMGLLPNLFRYEFSSAGPRADAD